MNQEKISLASDNWAPAHPHIMEALSKVNVGYAPAYGSDPWTLLAEKELQNAFQRPCKVYFIPTGTGGNVLALKLATKRHESVFATDIAHINTNECGALEAIVGCKIIPIAHQNGKLPLERVLNKIKSERALGKHTNFPRVISITQPTEYGTCYTLDELQKIAKFARSENLILHMDGSRLYNALVHLNISFHELIEACPCDLLTLGGTKNGLLSAEALLIFNATFHEGSEYIHKQTLQLLSKGRFLSSQFLPFFKNELWKSLASHANQKAKEIELFLRQNSKIKINYPVDTNQIFFSAPPSLYSKILEKIHCYPWDEENNEIRFVTSWYTSDEDVRRVKAALS